MYHQVAGGKICIGLQLLPIRFGLLGRRLPPALGQKLPLRQHCQGQLWILDTRRQSAQADLGLPCPGQAAALKIQCSGHFFLFQQPLEIFCPRFAAAQDQHTVPGLQILLHIGNRRFKAAAVG